MVGHVLRQTPMQNIAGDAAKLVHQSRFVALAFVVPKDSSIVVERVSIPKQTPETVGYAEKLALQGNFAMGGFAAPMAKTTVVGHAPI